MEIAIMIEGQMGVNWSNWRRIVRAVEDLGFVGLYRSDHFVNPNHNKIHQLAAVESLYLHYLNYTLSLSNNVNDVCMDGTSFVIPRSKEASKAAYT